MPGGGDPVGGGVQATDEGIGTFLPGATEGTGPVQGVQGGDGGGVCGRTHDESAWASGRGAMELEDLSHKRRAAEISNGLPVQGRPIELPGGDMPGTRCNEYGDAGSPPIPACPGNCVNSGGWKPPLPTVHPMQHAGTPEGTEQKAPCHS